MMRSLRLGEVRSDGTRQGRGVAYCANRACAQFLQLRVQAVAPVAYRCSACGELGELELERGMRSGDGPIVSEVRIEYGFDAARALYLERVAVRDPRWLRVGAVFTLQTPLIFDEKAAHSLGAALLRSFCTIHRHGVSVS